MDLSTAFKAGDESTHFRFKNKSIRPDKLDPSA